MTVITASCCRTAERPLPRWSAHRADTSGRSRTARLGYSGADRPRLSANDEDLQPRSALGEAAAVLEPTLDFAPAAATRPEASAEGQVAEEVTSHIASQSDDLDAEL